MTVSLFASRRFVNGAQDKVKVVTKTDDFTAKEWFADTVLLSQSLSQGDRSVPLAAVQQIKADDAPGFLTAEGSVTQELWQRLAQFGYGMSEPADIMPGARKFTPNPKTYGQMLSFLMATQVDVMTRPAVRKVSALLSRHRTQWAKMPRNLMMQLRIGFDRQQSITAPPTKKNPLFREFLRVGVVGRPDGTQWCATDLGVTTMPFIFDHLIFQLDENRRKANA